MSDVEIIPGEYIEMEQEIKQGIDFTDQGHRILVFYGDNKKQELQNLKIDSFYLDTSYLASPKNFNTDCIYGFFKTKSNYDISTLENISDIKSTEGLKYYDIDGSEVRITSTPKLETIYIQDSKNKKLFISEDLYNRYISKKEIKRIIDVLEKLAPKEIKITPIEIVSPGFAKIKPIYQEEEQAIKFKSFFPVKEEARKYLEREVEWDKVEDLKVPGYLKDVIDSRKHGLTEHSITVESKYLNEVDLSNKKVIFSEPMDIAIIDVSFWEHNHSNKENKQ